MRGLSAKPAAAGAEIRPDRMAHRFVVDGRTHDADLYVPREGAKAALVLVPGVARDGKDDPRLVAFARALSRARFLVLVPEIANLRDLRVSANDVTAIGDAVVHLAGKVVRPEVGLVAISYAAGPALIVALQERTRSKVRFVTAIGGYYDIEAVVTFFTTGHFRASRDVAWRHVEPNPYGKWVFLKSNANRIRNRADRSLLRRAADRKLRDPRANTGRLISRLGPEGRAVNALLVNRDPDRVPALISRLPSGLRRDMRRLSPRAYGVSTLKATLFLIHGLDDRVIPYTESEALKAAVPGHRARLYLVNNLAHVDFSPAGAVDFLTLWQATYDLLGLRDRMSRPRIEAPLIPKPAAAVR